MGEWEAGGVPEGFEQALRQKALRLLAVRDRTRAELRQRLSRGAPEAAVERVLAWLEAMGYVDDTRFARQWVRQRRADSGPRKLAYELRQKGLAPDLIRDELARWTSPEQTYQAAVNLVRKRLGRARELTRGQPVPGQEEWPGEGPGQGDGPAGERLRRRLVAWLLRRGFDGEVAWRAVCDALGQEGLPAAGHEGHPWPEGFEGG